MGWTSYNATYYKKNGKVDTHAECDAYFMEGLNRDHFEVVKSAMRGSVYYAAVKLTKRYTDERDADGNRLIEAVPENEQKIFAVVFLTAINMRDYYNFSYKEMDETYGPAYYDCPKGILDLLSPTENEYALKWRKKCRECLEEKKSPKSLSNLPVGARIRYTASGEEYTLQKMSPNYQFKSPWWLRVGTRYYVMKKNIPSDYEVL